ADRRSTKNAEISPAKNIDSADRKNSIASRALSSRGRDGVGSGPSSPPPSPGGGGMRSSDRRPRGGRAGGASRMSGLTSGSPPGRRRRPAPPRRPEECVARDGCAPRGPPSPGSCLVERQQREQGRQVEQRGEQDPARARGGRRQRLLGPERHERGSQRQGTGEVDATGQPDQRGEQAHD